MNGNAAKRWMRALRITGRAVKTLLLGLVMVEAACCMAVSLGNYFISGSVRDMEATVRYDPYAIYLKKSGPRPTVGNASPQEAGVVNVWVFGGSTVRSDTPDDAKTLPSLLAGILNTAGEKHFCIRNFGEYGFNSILEAKYMQKVLIENDERPDLVLFYDGANDCSYFTMMRTPEAHYGYGKLKAMVESYKRRPFGFLKPVYAAVYSSFTYELCRRIRFVATPVPQDAEYLEQFVDQVARRYDFLAHLSESYGAGFAVVWQPTRWVEATHAGETGKGMAADSAAAGILRRNWQLVSDRICATLADRAYFVDCRRVLEGETGVYSPDGVHLTDVGRKRAAARLAQVVSDGLSMVTESRHGNVRRQSGDGGPVQGGD